jgi:hypothetical protein
MMRTERYDAVKFSFLQAGFPLLCANNAFEQHEILLYNSYTAMANVKEGLSSDFNGIRQAGPAQDSKVSFFKIP